MENDNTVATGASSNAGILHGTIHTDGMEGTAPPPLADNSGDDNIKELDMPENEPAKIIDVGADNATYVEQEDPTGDNPGDKIYQN